MGGIQTGTQIVGNTAFKTATIDNSAPAYTIGDALGSKQTLSQAVRATGATGRIDSIVLTDKESKTPDLIIFFFNDTITGTTDNAAFAPTAVEIATKCVGHLAIAAADWVAAGANGSVVTIRNIGISFKAVGEDLIFQCKALAATDWTGTSQMDIKVGILQD